MFFTKFKVSTTLNRLPLSVNPSDEFIRKQLESEFSTSLSHHFCRGVRNTAAAYSYLFTNSETITKRKLDFSIHRLNCSQYRKHINNYIRGQLFHSSTEPAKQSTTIEPILSVQVRTENEIKPVERLQQSSL